MTICGGKVRRQNSKPSNEDQQQQPVSEPNYDKTQDIQTVELQEDPLANVRLLTPTLPGGCNDENAAKEAALRHKTNQYFPKWEIQTRRITNGTTKEEMKKMVAQLPQHPKQRYRKELRVPVLDKRNEKWKDAHVHWRETGLAFIIRSNDACRSKDDGGCDTIDSQNSKEDQERSKVNSEMPLSDKKPDRKPQETPRRSKQRTPGPMMPTQKSSKKSAKERKLEPTQEETMKSGGGGAKSGRTTPKTAGMATANAPSNTESGKSVFLFE